MVLGGEDGRAERHAYRYHRARTSAPHFEGKTRPWKGPCSTRERRRRKVVRWGASLDNRSRPACSWSAAPSVVWVLEY